MNPIQIPIIDISSLSVLDAPGYDNQTLAPVLSEIHQSLNDIGFMYIKGHGISQNLIDEIYYVSKEFFTMSVEEKLNISISKSGHQWRGYIPLRGLSVREGLFFGTEHPDDHIGVIEKWMMHGKNQYPNERFRAVISQYLDQLSQVAQRLMKAISLSLGLELDYFEKRRFTIDPTVILRIFNFPEQIQKEEWEVKEHTDYGFLTLFNQDQSAGLQINLKTGEWIEVPRISETLILNIGDLLELWTHGIYKATPHRIQRQGNGDRLSLTFLFDPNWKCTLEQIDEKLLRKADLNSVILDERRKRWDGIDLKHLSAGWTFGEQMEVEELRQQTNNEITDLAEKLKLNVNHGVFNRIVPCDGFNYIPYNSDIVQDAHWGCAWRCIQMQLSSLYEQTPSFQWLFSFFGKKSVLELIYLAMHNLNELPQYLKEAKYAPQELNNGWAEPFIGHLVLYYLGYSSKLYLINGYPNANAPQEVFEQILDYQEFIKRLQVHFEKSKSPVFIDDGTYASTIIQCKQNDQGIIILIADPHISSNLEHDVGIYDVFLDHTGKQISNSIPENLKQYYLYVNSYMGVEFKDKKWMCLFVDQCIDKYSNWNQPK